MLMLLFRGGLNVSELWFRLSSKRVGNHSINDKSHYVKFRHLLLIIRDENIPFSSFSSM